MANVREDFATVMAFWELSCVIMIDLLVIFETCRWLETFSTYFTLFGQFSVCFRYMFVAIFFLGKPNSAKITLVFLQLMIILYMNIKIPGVVKRFEAIFTLQSIATWFFGCGYVTLQRRAYESRNHRKFLRKGFLSF